MKKKLFVLVFVLVIAMIGCEDVVKELTTTISGKVTNDGEPVSGVYVILLEAGDSVSAGLSLSNGMITNSHGNYTMIAVSAGDYYVAAIDDANSNIIFDLDTDKVGYYGDPDTLGFTIPRTIHVNKGDDLEDIDITDLYQLQ
ncbi:MAG: carboxypeptidase regulatory-like domain-containing protein [Candidatus Cloacimonetes bacterium]|nr:carboxypeptidase regulatory-like domain-containing protein [Candidatus Cloacimonadota bacterium]